MGIMPPICNQNMQLSEAADRVEVVNIQSGIEAKRKVLVAGRPKRFRIGSIGRVQMVPAILLASISGISRGPA